MKFAVVGNLTIDIIKGTKRPGGGVYYSALALSKFADVTIYTKIGPDYPKEWLGEIEEFAEVVAFRGNLTTTFSLSYSGDERVIKVISKGEVFTQDELETIGEKNVIINPVANEIKSEHVELFRRPSLDIQGFVRNLSWKVELKDIEGGFLEKAFVVHASKEEYSRIRNPGMPDVLAITNGVKEGKIITKDEEITFMPEVVNTQDPTGAGDCFLALLTYGINKYKLQEALNFAIKETAEFLRARKRKSI